MDFDTYKRLKELREKHNLSQIEIAHLLHSSRQQVGKWENGIQMMGVDKYIKLAQFYNISVDYLLGLIDEPRPLH